MNEKFNNIISACIDTANYSVDAMLVLSNILKKMPEIKSKMAGKMFSTMATRTPMPKFLEAILYKFQTTAVFGKRSKRVRKNKNTRKRRSSSKRNKKNQSRRRSRK